MEGELTELETSLYRAFLRASGELARPLSHAAAVVGRPSDELDKALARLVDVGLVRAHDGDRYSAVSPLLAEALVLGVAEIELSARRTEIETRRAAIRQVIPDWAETLRQAPSPAPVDVVSDSAASGNVLMHYAERCQRELLAVVPGRMPARIDERTRTANLYTLRRGVKVRVLYQHLVLRDRPAREYLRELAGMGARLRFASSVPYRLMVIDGDLALLSIPGSEPGQLGVVVVHERHVVDWVVSTFEQLWADAAQLDELLDPVQAGDGEIDHTRTAILRMMADGEKDEAISRRLSISVRTCRRYIADYMAQVGATSRFQAGVIASRTGHLDSVPAI